MATGYTALLTERDDVTFNEFAWRCARAFRAFVMQRDDSLDATPILELNPDTGYHDKALAEARARLDRAESMTKREAQIAADDEYERVTNVYREIEEERKRKLAKYEAMMAEVEAWRPPTKDHEGMKKFMLEQLRDSISFDCNPVDKDRTGKKKTGAEWRLEEIAAAWRDIEYHTNKIAEELKLTKERNAWIAALVASIGMPPKK